MPLLLIIASELFSTKYSRLNHLFIPALKRFFCIPYTGQHGLQIRTHTSSQITFKSLYPHIFISFVFRSTCRLSDFFPFKDRIPFAKRSHVVYKYKCQCCGALYVGQTRRNIHTRISEHKLWEFCPKLVSQMSAVLTHHLSKHTISDSDFTIPTSGNSIKVWS